MKLCFCAIMMGIGIVLKFVMVYVVRVPMMKYVINKLITDKDYPLVNCYMLLRLLLFWLSFVLQCIFWISFFLSFSRVKVGPLGRTFGNFCSMFFFFSFHALTVLFGQ